MDIEELREWLETEIDYLTNAARAEVRPESENNLVGQRYMCKRVLDRIDTTYSDEEEG